MARPKVENSQKLRRWKSVVHNVKADCSVQADALINHLGPIRYQIAVEPYTHQEGHHLHIYCQFKNQRHFTKLLKELELISSILRDRVSGDPDHKLGRVELTQWTPGQTWENINKYLVNPTKEKITGEVTSRNNIQYVWVSDLQKYILKDVSEQNKKKAQAVRDYDNRKIIQILQEVRNLPPI